MSALHLLDLQAPISCYVPILDFRLGCNETLRGFKSTELMCSVLRMYIFIFSYKQILFSL